MAVVVVVVAAVALMLRLRLDYNGPHLDESDYLYVGRVLHAGKPWNTYTYMFSSRIPLFVLNLGEQLGGLLGARAVAAVLGLGSLGFVFAATRGLYGRAVALWATALVALQSSHIFCSKFATYDIVAVFFFSATACLLVVTLTRARRAWLLAIATSIAFALAVLSKYVVVVHAPILVVIVAVRRPRLLPALLAPCAVIMAYYAHAHWADLKQLYEIQVVHAHARNTTRLHILAIAATYCAPTFALSLIAIGIQIARTGRALRPLGLHLALVALALTMIAMHLRAADMVSMFKHMVYPTLALSPLAALVLDDLCQRTGVRGKVLAALIVAALAALGVHQVGEMERSFPNLNPMIDYLRPHYGSTTTILSEEGYVFRYMFAGSGWGKNLFEFSWFDQDADGQHTPQDVIDAIADGKPDYVFVFDQYTFNLTKTLRGWALPHGYRRVFTQPYILSDVASPVTTGTIELWHRLAPYTGKYPL